MQDGSPLLPHSAKARGSAPVSSAPKHIKRLLVLKWSNSLLRAADISAAGRWVEIHNKTSRSKKCVSIPCWLVLQAKSEKTFVDILQGFRSATSILLLYPMRLCATWPMDSTNWSAIWPIAKISSALVCRCFTCSPVNNIVLSVLFCLGLNLAGKVERIIIAVKMKRTLEMNADIGNQLPCTQRFSQLSEECKYGYEIHSMLAVYLSKYKNAMVPQLSVMTMNLHNKLLKKHHQDQEITRQKSRR